MSVGSHAPAAIAAPSAAPPSAGSQDLARSGGAAPLSPARRLAGIGELGWGLLPLLVVVLGVAAGAAAGRSRTVGVAENLPTPPVSSGVRVVDLVQASVASRVLDVRLDARGSGGSAATSLARDVRRRVQLWTGGRSALVVVRDGGASGARFSALAAALAGHARLQLVADRDWIELDRPGGVVDPATVRIISLTGRPLALATLPAEGPARDVGRWAMVSDPLAVADAGSPEIPVRVRLVREAPLSLADVAQRLAFFLGSSPLGLAAGVLGLLLCCWSSAHLGSRPTAGLLTAAVAGPALLYVALIPPLQNADETSHAGTLEALVWRSPDLADRSFPQTVSDLAIALEQDRVQHSPDELLPLAADDARQRIHSLLTAAPPDFPVASGSWPPGASIQPASRAPAFLLPFRPVAPLLRQLSLGDRLSAYRLGSLFLALAFFFVGARLLERAGASAGARLLFGLILLLPAAQSVLAAPTNYALALGVGTLAAALTCDGLLWRRERELRCLLLLTALWVAATSAWRDAALIGPVAAVCSLAAWMRRPRTSRRRTGAALGAVVTALLLAVLCVLSIAWALRVETLDTSWLQRPRRLGVAEMATAAALVALPALLAFFLAAVGPRSAAGDPRRRRILGRRLGAGVGFSVFFLAVALPHTTVPYERVFLPLPELAGRYLQAFFANALSWDQDILAWKLWVGALGWHDAFYPDGFYFFLRCLITLLVVALPTLLLQAAATQPRRFAVALRISGVAASLAMLVLALRHAFQLHPTIRYVLPLLPTILLPLGALAGPRAEPWLRLGIRLGIAAAVWGAVAVAGQRWLIYA